MNIHKVKKRLNILFTILVVGLLSPAIKAQNSNPWAILSMVSFKSEFDSSIGMEVKKPTVQSPALKMNGTEITIEGYFIPLDGKNAQSHFMLSKFTQNMCYFCGKAGPETAMQVFMANAKKVKYSDEKIKLTGILRINQNDPNSLLYTLEDATLIQ